jgi:hypothetical protein
MTQTPLRKFYLSVDIENTGCSLHNPVVAIGVYLAPADADFNVAGMTDRRTWCVQPLPGQVDEQICMDEYWSKHAEKLQVFRERAEPPEKVMRELLEWCLAKVSALGPRAITIVTTCPESDLGRLEFLGWSTGVWDRPIRYLGGTTRHSVADPNERLAQLGPGAKTRFKEWLRVRAPHAALSHWPDEDAVYAYWQMVFCDENIPAPSTQL